MDQNQDKTLLFNFGFCWRTFKTFLMLDLKEDPCMLLHVAGLLQVLVEVKVGTAAGTALVFTTRSNFICRGQFWHFHWNTLATSRMFRVTFLMICVALCGPSAAYSKNVPNWLHSFVLVQFCFAEIKFCAILHQFPIWLHFCTKLFSAHATVHFCTCCAQEAQCITLCSWHCDFNVNNSIRQFWKPMCTYTQCELIYVDDIVTFVCTTVPWWTIC